MYVKSVQWLGIVFIYDLFFRSWFFFLKERSFYLSFSLTEIPAYIKLLYDYYIIIICIIMIIVYICRIQCVAWLKNWPGKEADKLFSTDFSP